MLKEIAAKKKGQDNSQTMADSFSKYSKVLTGKTIGEKDFTETLTQADIENTSQLEVKFESVKNIDESKKEENKNILEEENKLDLNLNPVKVTTEKQSQTNAPIESNNCMNNNTTKDMTWSTVEDIKRNDKNNTTMEDITSPAKISNKDFSSLEYLITEKEQDESFINRYPFLVNIKDKDGNPPSHPDYNPSTLFISTNDFNNLRPFEKQYWEIKSDLFDTIVFVKMGKLYENDALLANKLFDLRVKERSTSMKLAGVPDVQYDVWASKFLNAGYKVARVDERESLLAKKMREKEQSPNKSVKKTIIERNLTEIVTPGTMYNDIMSPLPFYTAVLLSDVHCSNNSDNTERCSYDYHYSIILYDSSINSLYSASVCDNYSMDNVSRIFAQYDIKEVITNVTNMGNVINKSSKIEVRYAEKVEEEIREEAKQHCGIINNSDSEDNSKKTKTSNNLLVFNNAYQVECFMHLYKYFKYLHRHHLFKYSTLSNINNTNNSVMHLDAPTIRNMDILVNNYNNSKSHSLFDKINMCTTPFGVRKLHQWILQPLVKVELIEERRERVRCMKVYDRSKIVNLLKQLGDYERKHCKLKQHKVKIEELHAFLENNKVIMNILDILQEKSDISNTNVFYDCTYFIDGLTKILATFNDIYVIENDSIEPKQPTDELFAILNEKHQVEKELVENITEISKRYNNIKLNYKNVTNDIFQIEVSKEDYENVILKNNNSIDNEVEIFSKTKNTVRFYTPRTKELILRFKEAEERVFQAKNHVLVKAVGYFDKHSMFFRELIEYLSTVDCTISYSIFNEKYEGIFNEMEFIKNSSSTFEAMELTNPIYHSYISNDYSHTNTTSITTGPNMGGKSTFLRSVCLNIILAQMGLNVAAKSLKMSVVDQIFTRIGASDSLANSESTFMVEMSECSRILSKATKNSFVILDELGRGTSTRDGEGVCYAVLKYINKNIKCMTLFSTHYYNLINNIDIDGIEKYYMDYTKSNSDILFKYKITKGVSDESHGIYVAKMAGVPEEILERAEEIKKEIIKQ